MIELTDTNASGIAAELVRARTRAGSPVMGMVLTLVIVVDEDQAPAAMEAAQAASHEHPARVLGVIASSSAAGVGRRLARSRSTGTGTKPASLTSAAIAGCVIAETTTSAPSGQSDAVSSRS